jgi:hypothetical protein
MHSNRPSERSPAHCPLNAATFAAVEAEDRKREEAYARYLALFNTPEYQAKVAAAMVRHGVKP